MIFDERIATKASPSAAFTFLGDFNNLGAWDPSITRVEQITAGAVGLGTKFRVTLTLLGVETTLDYHVETWEPDHHAVLIGTSSTVTATDTIFVTPFRDGSRVRWKAEIRFVFPLQVVDPLFAWVFGPSVRRAVANMKAELDKIGA